MTLEQLKEKATANGLVVKGDFIEFDIKTPNFQILPNFKLHEFLTKNQKDTYTLLSLKIMLQLQELRTKFGSGIGVSSSYRSPAYNRSVGGATASEHAKGRALDTYPINGKIKAWTSLVKANKKTGGIGTYKTFVHIDDGKTRSWIG